ncbi:MAG TPA: hypothetical protein VI138_02570 [Candidatus Dormibacteraeota bacterium]
MSTGGPSLEQARPPITQVAVASMALVITGGIYLAAYLPGQAPTLLPLLLVSAGALLLLAAVALLLGLRRFAWDRFFQVSGWALVAYVVIAGMLEYVILTDGTRGSTLALLTGALLIFALDIPIVLGFSVAQHQEVGASPPA